MTIWNPTAINPNLPIYLSIADALGEDIDAGKVRPGDRLPTHRDLARTLGVNVMTVSRAYAEASRRGLVEGEVGRGTFVRSIDQRESTFLPLDPNGEALIDFHFNVPAGRLESLETKEIFESFAAHPERSHVFSGYSATGQDEHREAGADWMMRFGVEATPERTIVCGGAQHAMTMAFSAVGSPGDLMVTDELTYPGAKALASVLHMRLRPLPMDEFGLLPDAFEDECRRGQAKAIYTMPTVHNPTGTVLSEHRREAIGLIARKYGLVVIEDDTYGYLCAERPRPIYSYAPERTIYITGTSKSLAPGLRIGYLHAPASETESGISVDRLAANAAAIAWAASPMTAEIASQWIRGGQADDMVRWKRQEAIARRRLFDSLVPELETHSYAGSSHVWVTLPDPWRGPAFAEQARLHGVALTPAEAFVVGRSQAPHAVRLCLGTPPERHQVKQGLKQIAKLLLEKPGRCAQVV